MQDNIVATVQNDSGRRFNVRIVRRGDRYGLNDCLTHGEGKNEIRASIASRGYDGAMIEFYDAKYENAPGFGSRGQFVTRYYLSTLALDARKSDCGLDLHGGVAEWKINRTNLLDAIASAERAFMSASAPTGGQS